MKCVNLLGRMQMQDNTHVIQRNVLCGIRDAREFGVHVGVLIRIVGGVFVYVVFHNRAKMQMAWIKFIRINEKIHVLKQMQPSLINIIAICLNK
jgi:hypothetical protein